MRYVLCKIRISDVRARAGISMRDKRCAFAALRLPLWMRWYGSVIGVALLRLHVRDGTRHMYAKARRMLAHIKTARTNWLCDRISSSSNFVYDIAYECKNELRRRFGWFNLFYLRLFHSSEIVLLSCRLSCALAIAPARIAMHIRMCVRRCSGHWCECVCE